MTLATPNSSQNELTSPTQRTGVLGRGRGSLVHAKGVGTRGLSGSGSMETPGRMNSKHQERQDRSPARLPGQRLGRGSERGGGGGNRSEAPRVPPGKRWALGLQVGGRGADTRPGASEACWLQPAPSHVGTIFGALWRPLRVVRGASALPGPQPVAPRTLASSPGALPIAPRTPHSPPRATGTNEQKAN